MSDRGSNGPSSLVLPSDVTSAAEGLPNQNYQEPAGNDAFDFEHFLTRDSNTCWDSNHEWDFHNELDNYRAQQNLPLHEPNPSVVPSIQHQEVNQNPSNTPYHRNELEVSTYDWQWPDSAEPKPKMVDEVKRQRSFNCPYRVAEANLGRTSFSCIGCQEKNMGGIRRHLTRPLRKKRPPHLPFLKLCPTCNEDFLDRVEFEQNHGNEGEACNNPQKQRKGDEGQQEQWDALYAKIVPHIIAEVGESSVATRMRATVPQAVPTQDAPMAGHRGPWNRSRSSSYHAAVVETPDQDYVPHVESWDHFFDNPWKVDNPYEDDPQTTLSLTGTSQISSLSSYGLDEMSLMPYNDPGTAETSYSSEMDNMMGTQCTIQPMSDWSLGPSAGSRILFPEDTPEIL
ncbi:hypothetical protein N0V83_003352 [Neocucurbitaria cava]|uniref:Uncharacterized protein n=1 Tax=Neocucurbitaria cava TaxID=798079 RepID=A0A9W8YC33_9PLEO|nr:hypothetical protein N0V83_003352 [Neocucurbitaria cava]